MALKDNYTQIALHNIGDQIKDRPLLIIALSEKSQKNGGTYVDVKTTDGFSKIDMKFFNKSVAELASKGISEGMVADFDLFVQDFNGAKSIRIDDIRPSKSGAVPTDFLVTAPIDTKVAFDKICEYLQKKTAAGAGGEYTPITDLAYQLLQENKDAFIFAGAAKGMHHDLIGGLMYHTYRMFAMATRVCQIYKSLDEDILISAVALHDIAKLREMNTSPMGDITYTVEGQLMGHLYMGAEMIHDYALANPGKYDPEKVMLLKHMILSHHLNPEWGAVKGPSTAEAQMLHYIDQIDAKMYVFETRFEDLAPGSVTDKVPFGLENYVYKPKS